ncbi:MAG: hypothetical protein HY369_00995 [Candidatus Aenigmarchaeota archaeon]|nr:hypothetical protein [Candidatus Aenigmarchaeota archaeon]
MVSPLASLATSVALGLTLACAAPPAAPAPYLSAEDRREIAALAHDLAGQRSLYLVSEGASAADIADSLLGTLREAGFRHFRLQGMAYDPTGRLEPVGPLPPEVDLLTAAAENLGYEVGGCSVPAAVQEEASRYDAAGKGRDVLRRTWMRRAVEDDLASRHSPVMVYANGEGDSDFFLAQGGMTLTVVDPDSLPRNRRSYYRQRLVSVGMDPDRLEGAVVLPGVSAFEVALLLPPDGKSH